MVVFMYSQNSLLIIGLSPCSLHRLYYGSVDYIEVDIETGAVSPED